MRSLYCFATYIDAKNTKHTSSRNVPDNVKFYKHFDFVDRFL
jgi:hypothetical protein